VKLQVLLTLDNVVNLRRPYDLGIRGYAAEADQASG